MRLFVIGNGPSLRNFKFEDLSTYGFDTIGMNAAYRYWDTINWYPTYYSCLDTAVIESHQKQIRRLIKEERIKKFFLLKQIAKHDPLLLDNKNIYFFEDLVKGPFTDKNIAFKSCSPGKVTTGSYATRFGMYLGYKEIYLLGIDCRYVEIIKQARKVETIKLEIVATPKFNPNYFFNDYQQKGDIYNIPNPHVHRGNLHCQVFEIIKKDIILNKLGCKVYNCNPESILYDKDVFKFKNFDDVCDKNKMNAVIIPISIKQEDELFRHLTTLSRRIAAKWSSNIDLIYFTDEEFPEGVKKKILDIYDKSVNLKAFNGISFVTSSLPKEDNIYIRNEQIPPKKLPKYGFKSGPNYMFFEFLKIFRKYRYAFYMESDCYPIRDFWLDELCKNVNNSESFWVKGSVYRGSHSLSNISKNHINGNAIYATGSRKFNLFISRDFEPWFLEEVKKKSWLPYDVAFNIYFNQIDSEKDDKKWKNYQNYLHKFKYTDFIQNYGHISDKPSAKKIRQVSKNTFVVHSKNLEI
jgi:hypothetical protein